MKYFYKCLPGDHQEPGDMGRSTRVLSGYFTLVRTQDSSLSSQHCIAKVGQEVEREWRMQTVLSCTVRTMTFKFKFVLTLCRVQFKVQSEMSVRHLLHYKKLLSRGDLGLNDSPHIGDLIARRLSRDLGQVLVTNSNSSFYGSWSLSQSLTHSCHTSTCACTSMTRKLKN